MRKDASADTTINALLPAELGLALLRISIRVTKAGRYTILVPFILHPLSVLRILVLVKPQDPSSEFGRSVWLHTGTMNVRIFPGCLVDFCIRVIVSTACDTPDKSVDQWSIREQSYQPYS